MKKFIIAVISNLLFLFLLCNQCNANETMISVRKIGKVKTTITWDLNEHEERQKAIIISLLADSLLSDLNFNHDIRFNFTHLISDQSLEKLKMPKYTLKLESHDKGPMEIILSINSYEFETENILKILDYAVKNYKRLKKENPRKISQFNFRDFNFDYFENRIGDKPMIERLYLSESYINHVDVLKALNQPASKSVKKVMEKKIYRPLYKNESALTEGISYYMQNGKYYIFHRYRDFKNKTSKDSIVLVLNSIFQLENKNKYDRALIFDSNNSFYYIDKFNKNFLSKRHIIPYMKSKYYPYDIQFPGNSIISISISQPMIRDSESNIIYRIKDDLLIPDLDAVLDSLKHL